MRSLKVGGRKEGGSRVAMSCLPRQTNVNVVIAAATAGHKRLSSERFHAQYWATCCQKDRLFACAITDKAHLQILLHPPLCDNRKTSLQERTRSTKNLAMNYPRPHRGGPMPYDKRRSSIIGMPPGPSALDLWWESNKPLPQRVPFFLVHYKSWRCLDWPISSSSSPPEGTNTSARLMKITWPIDSTLPVWIPKYNIINMHWTWLRMCLIWTAMMRWGRLLRNPPDICMVLSTRDTLSPQEVWQRWYVYTIGSLQNECLQKSVGEIQEGRLW